jgi:hypothetical protein
VYNHLVSRNRLELRPAEEFDGALSPVVEEEVGSPSDESCTAEVEAPRTVGDGDVLVVPGKVLIRESSDCGALTSGAEVCSGVEVEETNGGGFSIYVPSGSTT